ncbi:hypothetical protein [Streptacidiphilus sp. PAMC 29251]
MDWIPLVSTVLGALICVVATTVADRSRWKRQRSDKAEEVKRRVYVEYLSALSRTDNALRDTARNPTLPQIDRATAAQEAFRAGGCYELRYHIGVVAPEPVVEAATATFRTLRDLRDLVEAGTTHSDDAYRSQRDMWYDRFPSLRRAMREDLNAD